MRDDAIIIGGTFNPITNAHLQMGIKLKEEYPLADVIYIPSNLKFISSWKNIEDSDVFCDKNRIALLKSVLNFFGFKMSLVEVDEEVDGSTYDTVMHFKKAYKNVSVAIGIDKLQELSKWKNVKELLDIANFFVFNRGPEFTESLIPNCLLDYKTKLKAIKIDGVDNVSSTVIRTSFKKGNLDEIKNLVPEEVYNFLKKERQRYV